MSERIKITEAQGEELQEESYLSEHTPVEIDGHGYMYHDTEVNVEEHRWATTDLYVYERDDGKLFGMLYDIGSTEEQESGFVYNEPILREVQAKTKTVTTYEAVR